MTAKLFTDNGGFYHLAILDEHDNCIYYLCDQDKSLVRSTMSDFEAGSDPIADGWDGGESNPQACYRQIQDLIALSNGGACEITFNQEV